MLPPQRGPVAYLFFARYAALSRSASYDRRLRLTRLSSILDDPPEAYGVEGGPLYLQDWQYVFDRASNIKAIRDLRTPEEAGEWSPSPADQEYAYDALYRLVRNRTTYAIDEPDRPHTQTWAYDYLGNMTDWRDEDAGGAAHFFDRSLGAITNGIDDVPDGSVRPDALVSARLDADNHLEATYNASGDMELLTVTKTGAETVHDYEWDQVHRLVSAQVSTDGDDIRSDFTYDYADQRRIKRTDLDEVLYFSDSYEVRTEEQIPTKWLHVGTQRLLRVSAEEGRAAEVSFYISNHLGTTGVVIDADSAPRSASTYLPYGALEAEVVSADDFDPTYRFTGKERDQATGLDYFGARYYAARLGRWLSPDPSVLELGTVFASTRGGNPYLYGFARPLQGRDPSGRDFELMVVGDRAFIRVNYMVFRDAAVTQQQAARFARNAEADINIAWGGRSFNVHYKGTTVRAEVVATVRVAEEPAPAFDAPGIGRSLDYREMLDDANEAGFENVIGLTGHYVGSSEQTGGHSMVLPGSGRRDPEDPVPVSRGPLIWEPRLERQRLTVPRNITEVGLDSPREALLHEVGHILGLDDMYQRRPSGGATSYEGWSENIMGAGPGRVEQRNIAAVLRGAEDTAPGGGVITSPAELAEMAERREEE